MVPMDLFTNQDKHHRYRKQTYGYQGGKEMGRDKLGDWDGYTHTVIKRLLRWR